MSDARLIDRILPPTSDASPTGRGASLEDRTHEEIAIVRLPGWRRSPIAAAANGQATTSYEDGPDGVKYRVTRQVVQRSIPTTEYQTRKQKVYQSTGYDRVPIVPTDLSNTGDAVPIRSAPTELVESACHGAYWTHDLQPVTHGRHARRRSKFRLHERTGLRNTDDASSGDHVSHGTGGISRAAWPLAFRQPVQASRQRRRPQANPSVVSNTRAIRRARRASGPAPIVALHNR